MKSIIIGLIFILAAVFAILPAGLGWKDDVLTFLRGAVPVIACFVGIVVIFVGIADIRDRAQAKKEKKENETPN